MLLGDVVPAGIKILVGRVVVPPERILVAATSGGKGQE